MSEAGREEAREVANSTKWSIDTAGKGKLRPSGKRRKLKDMRKAIR